MTATLTVAQEQADFDLMRQALEEAHAGLYRYSTKAEMDQSFAAQRAKLNRPMTGMEFYEVVAETLARIRCGHTHLMPSDEMQKAISTARKFPLRVLVEGKRLMVLLNETPDDRTIRPGMEILEINGRPAADILSRLWLALPADGDIETGKRHDITGGFGKLYWMLIDQTGDFTLKTRDAAGTMMTAKLAGVTDADRKSNRNPVNATMLASIAKLMDWTHENLSLRFLKEPQIAEVRIRSFIGDDYPQWIENTFRALREKGTQCLILDLRGNGGGKDEYGAMLVSYLTDKPFRYFDHISLKTIAPSFAEHSDWNAAFEGRLLEGTTPNPPNGYLVTPNLHPGVAEQSPAKYPFLGKVVVLTDGGTFSTAADFCAVTHHLKRATFIGEETGGGYYGNNSGLETTLTLPNSKLRVRVPMYEYWNAVPGYEGKRRGTLPDRVVELKVADVLRGEDEALNLALKLAVAGAAPLR